MVMSLRCLKSLALRVRGPRFLAIFLFVLLGGELRPAQASITLVQHTSKDAGTTTTSSLAFVSPNTSGNWIAVVVRAGVIGEVLTVTDSIGNTYHSARQSTQSGITLGIFYAENIKGGANTITASDTISGTLRFAIFEYSGVVTSNSLDVTVSAQGNNTSPNSGSSTTTSNGDLLLGAIATVNAASYTAGSSYAIEERVPAEPGTKLIVEDQIQGTAGAASASATLAASDNWGAILAAFKAAGGGGGTPTTMTANTGTTPQSANVSTAFANPLAVTVKDAGNNPVSGVNVTFTAPGSGASGVFSNSTGTIVVATNASGVASAAFTANATAGGPYTVTAMAAGLTTVNFSLTNTAGVATTMTANAGTTPQSANVSTAFANPLAVTVKDAGNNPVSGVNVTFTAPGSGASGVFSNSTATIMVATNASGVASAPFTANATAGGPYTVTAAATGLTTVNFSLTNLVSAYALSVSISSDRKYYVSGLQGAALAGNAFVFTSPASQLTNFNPTGITSVSFWLDNPAMTGSPMHTASATPYDFAGQTNTPAAGLANAWDTTTVPDGTHTITQSVSLLGGGTEVDTATFTVQNNLSTTITSGHFEYVFPDQSIYVYSLATFQLVKHVSMPQLTGIRGVGVVPSTHMLYISFGGAGGSNGNGSLLKYDLLTDTVVWTQSYSFGVDTFAITPDGKTIYMPDGASSGNGIWEILDASTGAVTGSINTGMNGPHNTIVSLDGTKVFMGPINSADLVEGNTSTNTVALNIGPLHQGVRPFTINGRHTLAFTTSNTPSGIGFQVSDATTGNVLYSVDSGFTIPSGFTFNSPVHGISLSPNEKEIYLIDTANAYAHVFDVSGLPSIAPVVVAHIPLTTNFSGFESPCAPNFNCVQEGWIRHTLDGHYVLVDDSGDVIDTTTRQVVNTIPQLFNTRKGNLEIDWQNGLPVATTTHFGLGYVTSSTPASITATVGTPQSAAINTAFATQLQATVKDASNNPVNGVTVTFLAPANGASGTFAGGVNTATTNAQGVATAPIFTANGTAGGPYIVTASVSGVSATTNFSLTNLASAPGSITAAAGTPQSATVNAAFATQLQATVKDASNSPVSGAIVTFTAPASGASGTFAGGVNTATTNAQGIATAPVFTANSTAGGPYTVTATVAGVATAASFSLTNLASSTFSVVQAAQNFSASGNTSITVPISTTAGNLLVIFCGNGGNNTATVTITDSAGQTWTQTTSGYASSASSNRSAMFYKPNSAAVTSVTATWTASANNIEAVVFEINGADPSSPADGSFNSSASGSAITSLTSGSLTTANANDILIYGTRSQSNETTWTAGSGYTIPANGSNTRQGMQYEIVSSTQSGVTTSMSWNSGAPGAAGIFAAFKTASGVAISPLHTAITTSETQQFTATVANNLQSFPLTWMVDGVAGGNASVGTITTTGLYTPPNAVGNHTVTVQVQTQSASAPVFVTNYPGTYMRDVDTSRTGQNLNESVLTPANVNSLQFGKLFSYSIDGYSDASPLYVANVNIPGQGLYDVVYVATEHDSVYAFDADGVNPSPLWHVSFINPAAGITTVGPSATSDTAPNMVEAGITGTPVIDPTTGTLYLVALTQEVSGTVTTFVQRLHALDITTGAEKFGGPVVIQASVPGTGDGGSGGQVPFIPLHENQRAALLLNNGIVYIAWAAHADKSPYHGWVMGYNAATLQQVMVYNTTPNGGGGGIWQSGDGLTTDSTGRIYAVTGNGPFNADIGGTEFGDSVLAINSNGTLSDYFTPHDQSTMAASDLDLGSGGVLLLPDQSGAHPHEAITGGKTGTIYVVDRDNLGHFNPNNDSQIVQTLVNTLPGGTFQTGNFKAPIYFNGHVYFSADQDTIKAFAVTNGLLSTSPTSQTSVVNGYPGCTLQISANGSSNGILWAIQSFFNSNQSDTGTAHGILHAYDAGNLTNELYNTNQAAAGRDQLDFAVKWAAPLIANGKVFVATTGHLNVFGLLH